MERSLKTCGSKHKHETLTCPNLRRLGQQQQSGKSWQKQGNMLEKLWRYARKQEHARKSNKNICDRNIFLSKEDLGKAIKRKGCGL